MIQNRGIAVNQIIYPAKNPERWFGITVHAELYRGSTHGCFYGESHENAEQEIALTVLQYKSNALELMLKELTNKTESHLIGLGQLSDPYNELDSELHLTSSALELIERTGHGVALFTKNDGVFRDIAILKRIASKTSAVVIVPISTVNEAVLKKLEPASSTTAERFRLIQKLTNEGIRTGVVMSPIVPFINDNIDNATEIVNRAKAAGSVFVYPSFGMMLSGKQRERFFELIDREFPGLKNVYMDTFGSKYSLQSANAGELKKNFVFACRKQKILYGMNDIVKAIRPDSLVQMKLF